MSHLVFARKYRPQSLEEIVGQSHVVKALSNSFSKNKLHHAYLFSGTRGVGKTTLGRIIAKCLNCESGISATPCETCTNCISITEGRFVDLIEVDGASRTKVEDTRDLLSNVQYMPSVGRFKIYLIDEVHMLSTHSFNALLKTLEEPPEHVKFILATTDPQKLPITVLSRCLQFKLRALSETQIKNHLATILEKENINYSDDALLEIASSADGSMRDALSILEHIVAISDGDVKTENLRELLGIADAPSLGQLIACIFANDRDTLYRKMNSLTETTTDYNKVLEKLSGLLHQMSLVKLFKQTENIPKWLHDLSETIDEETIQLYYQITITGRADLALAPSPKLGFEMTMMRLLAFCPNTVTPPKITKQKNKSNQEKVIPDSTTVEAAATVQTITQEKTQTAVNALKSDEVKPLASTPEITKPPKNEMRTPSSDISDWADTVSSLDLEGLSKTLAHNCALVSYDNHKITLNLDPLKAALLNKNAKNRIQIALSKQNGSDIKLEIEIATGPVESPACLIAAIQKEKHTDALSTLDNSPVVSEILNTFDAKIIPETISVQD